METEQCAIALLTFNKLKEKMVSQEYNYSMEIFTSNNYKLYIGFCSIFNNDHLVINEEYELFPALNNKKIVSIEFMEQHIKHLVGITYISLRKVQNRENKFMIYYYNE